MIIVALVYRVYSLVGLEVRSIKHYFTSESLRTVETSCLKHTTQGGPVLLMTTERLFQTKLDYNSTLTFLVLKYKLNTTYRQFNGF